MKPQSFDDVHSFRVQIDSVDFTVTITDRIFASEKDFFYLPHNHSVYEIQYIAEGTCQINTQKKGYTAQKGDIFINHPNEYHVFIRPKDENVHFTIFSMYLAFEKEQSEIQDPPCSSRTLESLLNSRYHIHDSTGKVEELLLLIHNELVQKRFGYKDAVRGLLTVLLTKIFQLLIPVETPTVQDKKSLNDSDRMITIERFFLFNYHKDVTVQDLANELYVCSRRANQILNEMFGCSFTRKLTLTRLEVAKFLLKNSDYTITDISSMCGFNNKNYFNTVFRQEFNATPLDYRMSSKTGSSNSSKS
ncbi:MAG: AraC family transcriptional regulator [Clostridiaceae bacterium]|jgi:AraC-like DNA-binding protein|nr:AraC family transcriptional regulator [Clostridiaceae bacterium]